MICTRRPLSRRHQRETAAAAAAEEGLPAASEHHAGLPAGRHPVPSLLLGLRERVQAAHGLPVSEQRLPRAEPVDPRRRPGAAP